MIMGYVALREDKTPKHKFKDTGGKTWEEVKDEENIAIVVPNPFVVLDFDTVDDARIMQNIVEGEKLRCNMMKTDRGIHCWFKSPKQLKNYTKNRLAIGIYSDRKVGNRNALIVIRRYGKDREWLQKFSDDEIDILPRWLTPIAATVNHFNFLDMSEGSGRNQELFNYILYLKDKGFNRLEIDQTLRIVNKYVFSEPLPENEINTILREESFEKEPEADEYDEETGGGTKDTKFKFEHEVFGDTLADDMNIVSVNDVLYIYKDGYYQRDDKNIEARMIDMYKKIKDSQRKEVLKYLNVITNKSGIINELEHDPYEVNLMNCKLNLKTGEVKEHSCMDYDFTQIPVEYDPEADSDVLHEFLDNIFCHNTKVKDLFFEIMGDCLLTKPINQKAFIFFGDGSNGKSSLFFLMEKFLGARNVSHIAIDSLAEKFSTAELQFKCANICDDLNYKAITDSGTLKKLITGDPIQVERKFEKPFSFKSYATQIFATNELPYSYDKSYGMMRRLCFIPCLARFGKDGLKRDPHIQSKLSKPNVLSALLNEAIAGLKRVEINGGFTEPEIVVKAKEKYRAESSSVISWIEETDTDLDKVISTPAASLFAEYVLWAKTYYNKPVGKRTFNTEMKYKFGLDDDLMVRRFNDKTARFFVLALED